MGEGDAELVDTLLKSGANVDAADPTGTTPTMVAAASGDAASATEYTQQVAGPLVVAMVLVYVADHAVQRAVGTLLFVGLICWFTLLGHDAAVDPGMRWAAPLLCLKYLMSHVPRHEPYV